MWIRSMFPSVYLLGACLCLVFPGRMARGQGPCEPGWQTAIGQPGANSTVQALQMFDDGTGRALYAGGDFTFLGATGAKRIATWDGSTWSPLGTGMGGLVRALAVFDDGTGGALYAGGDFNLAGGVEAHRIARWDGSAWAPLGIGMPDVPASHVHALATFDTGSGLALYAAGTFIKAGGVEVNRIAKWNGSTWTALGTGINGTVDALAVFDAGGGPELYATGSFTQAGDLFAIFIAKWNGSSWSAVGGGLEAPGNALVVHDDGSGPALFVGTDIGATGVSAVSRWDGSSWTQVASADNLVLALTSYDDGHGFELFAGGDFTSIAGVPAKRAAKWNGSVWSALGTGTDDAVKAFATFDDGQGTSLYAGGEFDEAGDVTSHRVAAWGCPHAPSPWLNLGFALAGTMGEPLLVGTGELLTGTAGWLQLSQAAPSSTAHLVIALTSTPTPFKCGTLVPVPILREVTLVTDPAGGAALSWTSWPAGLSGTSVYLQYVIPDSGAICDVALSNALLATVP